jgi:hypothetical protein
MDGEEPGALTGALRFYQCMLAVTVAAEFSSEALLFMSGHVILSLKGFALTMTRILINLAIRRVLDVSSLARHSSHSLWTPCTILRLLLCPVEGEPDPSRDFGVWLGEFVSRALTVAHEGENTNTTPVRRAVALGEANSMLITFVHPSVTTHKNLKQSFATIGEGVSTISVMLAAGRCMLIVYLVLYELKSSCSPRARAREGGVELGPMSLEEGPDDIAPDPPADEGDVRAAAAPPSAPLTIRRGSSFADLKARSSVRHRGIRRTFDDASENLKCYEADRYGCSRNAVRPSPLLAAPEWTPGTVPEEDEPGFHATSSQTEARKGRPLPETVVHLLCKMWTAAAQRYPQTEAFDISDVDKVTSASEWVCSGARELAELPSAAIDCCRRARPRGAPSVHASARATALRLLVSTAHAIDAGPRAAPSARPAAKAALPARQRGASRLPACGLTPLSRSAARCAARRRQDRDERRARLPVDREPLHQGAEVLLRPRAIPRGHACGDCARIRRQAAGGEAASDPAHLPDQLQAGGG